MAKDKKKKSEKKKDKVLAPAENAVSTLKSLGSNKLVGEVVAAALVATAAALRDSDKARRLASAAGDELEKLSKDATQRGSAMWQLAIDVGRRALESVGGEAETRPARAKARTTAKDTSKAKPAKPAGAKKAKASAKKA